MNKFDNFYRRAMDNGYTHDEYNFEVDGIIFPTVYVIKRCGERLEPEDIISSLQELEELKAVTDG